jgi:hypothetical protein
MATEEEAKGSPDTDMHDTDTAEPLNTRIDKTTGLRTGSPIAVLGGGIEKTKRTPVPKSVPKSL